MVAGGNKRGRSEGSEAEDEYGRVNDGDGGGGGGGSGDGDDSEALCRAGKRTRTMSEIAVQAAHNVAKAAEMDKERAEAKRQEEAKKRAKNTGKNNRRTETHTQNKTNQNMACA